MASTMRIMMAGVQLVAGIVTLMVFALGGGIMMDRVVFPILKMVDPSSSAIDPAALQFIPGLYYMLLLLVGIAMVWRAYQQVVVTVDYYPGMKERSDF